MVSLLNIVRRRTWPVFGFLTVWITGVGYMNGVSLFVIANSWRCHDEGCLVLLARARWIKWLPLESKNFTRNQMMRVFQPYCVSHSIFRSLWFKLRIQAKLQYSHEKSWTLKNCESNVRGAKIMLISFSAAWVAAQKKRVEISHVCLRRTCSGLLLLKDTVSWRFYGHGEDSQYF